MRKLELRIKIEIIMAIFFIILLVTASVASITRTISDSGDNSNTFIRNSKGNYWSTTGMNLQTAINDLTNGGTIWIPDCNLSISSTLTLRNDINLIGIGKNSTLYLADNANINVININGKNNILIEKINVDGNTDGQSNHGVGLIDITSNSKNITIKNCYFSHSGKTHIDCQEGTSNILIEECYFIGKHNSGYGGAIWFSGSNCIARNNFIKDTYGCGIVMESETGYSPSKYHIIDGNVITGEIGHGIHMEALGGTNSMKSSNCTIINNHIHDLTAGGYGSVVCGILLAENSTCSNNRIRNVASFGIQINARKVIVTNNIISDITIYDGIQTIFAAGVTDVSDCIISNNYISNIKDDGIQLYLGGKNITIDGNIITNTGSEAIMIDVADHCIISNNVISDISYNCISNNGDNTTITGNYIYNAIGSNRGSIITTKSAIITNNNIKKTSRGIWCVATSLKNGLIISGNNIQMCTNIGINIELFGGVIVSDNIVNEVTSDGIHIATCNNLTANGNVISDTGKVNDGIEFASVQNSIAIGNVIRGFSNGIYESNGNNNIFIGNNCVSNTNGIIQSGVANVYEHNLENV